tara:strand:+ start:120 stop:338 length:219 start_codon:yes stop_codon:yes gene_type:complete
MSVKRRQVADALQGMGTTMLRQLLMRQMLQPGGPTSLPDDLLTNPDLIGGEGGSSGPVTDPLELMKRRLKLF